MDYDRKSTVSSFYGGRRTSVDALNNDFPPPGPPGGRTRADSASSFYGANRASRADPFDAGTPSAGYNRASYFDGGRTAPVKPGVDEESQAAADPAWDVYADFNNAGPRYSTAFGMGDDGYRQVPSPTPYSPGGAAQGQYSTSALRGEEPATQGNVEMVTVPALGPEWKAEEMRGMSKKAKREEKIENAAVKWKEWKRGQRGLCGKYFTRKFTAWFVFFLVAAIALVLVFTIPRVPGFSVNSADPLIAAEAPFNTTVVTDFSRAPTNFSFPGEMKLQADTGGNFLPLTFNNIHGSVFDLQTKRQVASGDTGKLTVPAKEFPIITLPLNFTYTATNDSDQTWVNWYNGCKNAALYADGKRPAVQFRLIIDMSIAGLIGKKSTSTDVTDAACPIELPQNSV
ncbi:uncharacterized protein TRAVEDRAFT_156213 [Trametes versicolor FP-101664 SS1]|uniref:uncharacterized protein n=1 Tax=Trametes versicolor (strain FP-101664) TaxID=717944 RepID=UPI000462234A|nr:uncharacterized protein TRAVEDRAFT_156213 [Trametes versicolor FP-101664 SS1]EIW52438.1 hypothetical protein TRAVEDRAFT_156213 [Trametes versicolor FP-101664 SS1]